MLSNKEKVILRILKDDIEYNANSISKKVGLTPMGCLKILRQLEKENIILSKKKSNIIFYNFNFKNQYAKDFASLILRKEADYSSVFIKRWTNEIRKIKGVNMSIIFGSVLTKGSNANDIDILFVMDKKDFAKIKVNIEKLNLISEKKIHPVYQTKEDLLKNLKNKDSVVTNIIKGVVVMGEKEFMNILEEGK
jgi:DNA-binding Lrp family transcriptional regulator